MQSTGKLLVVGLLRKARKVGGPLLVLAACSGVAYAGGGGGGGGGSGGGTGGGVPELDPTSVAGALTMLVGGVLMFTDRFVRK